MQTDKDDRPTDWEEPVRTITHPPGKVASVTEASIALCVWEQIGLLLERYQSQAIVESPLSD